jgi:hypothetical protein
MILSGFIHEFLKERGVRSERNLGMTGWWSAFHGPSVGNKLYTPTSHGDGKTPWVRLEDAMISAFFIWCSKIILDE